MLPVFTRFEKDRVFMSVSNQQPQNHNSAGSERSDNLGNKFSITPVAYVVVSFRDFFAVTTKTTGIIQFTKDPFMALLKGSFVFFFLCISCLLKQGRRLTVPILDALSRLDLDAGLLAEVRAFMEQLSRTQLLLSNMRARAVQSFKVFC